jgi:hypothetical protein
MFQGGAGNGFPAQHPSKLVDPLLLIHRSNGGGGSALPDFFLDEIVGAAETGDLRQVSDADELVFFG